MFRLSQLSSSSGFYSSSSHTIDHDAITQHDPTRIQNLLFSSSSLNNPHGLSLTPLLFGGEGGGSVHEQPSNHPPLDDGNANDFLHPIHQQQLNPQQPSHLDVNTTTTTSTSTTTNRISYTDFVQSHSIVHSSSFQPMIQNVNHYQQPIDASFGTYSSMIEIGKYAVWSVSTAKQGNGVEQLRDDNCETFWQSDGPQPHYINIQFHKVLSVQDVLIYLDYKKDESYTPQTISIRCGTSFHDLTHVKTVELEEPVGYICINMNDEKDQVSNCIRCNMLQIVISQNHLNGRDTHVRQVKVYGPIELKASSGAGVGTGVVAGVGGSGTGVGGIGGIGGIGRTSAMTNHNNSSLVSNNDILNGGTVASSMIDSSNTIQFSMFSTLR